MPPSPTIMACYNDAEGTAELIERHRADLAAIILEPMMGAGGAIVAESAFLSMLREKSLQHGIVLIFDEVMTSRLSPGGLQAKRQIIPDMTTFGKYLGGGLTFGAFGGKAVIMNRFDPRQPDYLGHSGTYNNNVLTMAAGCAGLEQAWTPAAAVNLNAMGDRLRSRLNAAFERRGVTMRMVGEGSINCIHFHNQPIRSPRDVNNDPAVQTLFHLEMLEHGIYMARRGFSALCLPLDEKDCEHLVEAVEQFTLLYGHLLRH